MQIDYVNIGLAFIEGFALIISPCILPILPIILGGSLTGSKARPLGIVTGFILVFSLVTLFSRQLIQITHIDQDIIRYISLIILFLLGVIMMSKTLTEKFNIFASRLSNVGSSLQSVNNPQSGFWGGMAFGGLVGIIWTPCAGPILAAVIVQVLIQQTSLNSMLVVTAFAIGAGLPMLLIALAGRTIIDKFGFLKEKTVLFRQILGFIIIVMVICLIFFPNIFIPVDEVKTTEITGEANSLINGIEHPYKVPALQGITAWVNSPPLTMDDLKGKVVLVDFWTYSCINCIRTFPYLKSWYAKYHDKGLVIIGVHSPEFQFEQNLDNVKMAVTNNEIHYPVALDNQFSTWRNFKNQYWPAHYLVNKQGEVVYIHFGEGEYDVTENNIRFLLGLHGTISDNKASESYALGQTPETYLGYRRANNFASPEIVMRDNTLVYSYPPELLGNQWALQGKWIISSEKIISDAPNAAIKLNFKAKKVYMVLGSATNKPIKIKVLLNGKPITEGKGQDVSDSEINVEHNQLYALVDLASDNQGELEIIATEPGLEAYTFTFGN